MVREYVLGMLIGFVLVAGIVSGATETIKEYSVSEDGFFTIPDWMYVQNATVSDNALEIKTINAQQDGTRGIVDGVYAGLPTAEETIGVFEGTEYIFKVHYEKVVMDNTQLSENPTKEVVFKAFEWNNPLGKSVELKVFYGQMSGDIEGYLTVYGEDKSIDMSVELFDPNGDIGIYYSVSLTYEIHIKGSNATYVIDDLTIKSETDPTKKIIITGRTYALNTSFDLNQLVAGVSALYIDETQYIIANYHMYAPFSVTIKSVVGEGEGGNTDGGIGEFADSDQIILYIILGAGVVMVVSSVAIYVRSVNIRQ